MQEDAQLQETGTFTDGLGVKTEECKPHDELDSVYKSCVTLYLSHPCRDGQYLCR